MARKIWKITWKTICYHIVIQNGQNYHQKMNPSLTLMRRFLRKEQRWQNTRLSCRKFPENLPRYYSRQFSSVFPNSIIIQVLCSIDSFGQSFLVDVHLWFQFLGNDKISVFVKIGYFVIILERDLKTRFIFNDLEHWCEADYSANSLIMSDLQSLNLNNPHILNFKKSPEKISLYFVQLALSKNRQPFMKKLWNGHDSQKRWFLEIVHPGESGRSSFFW